MAGLVPAIHGSIPVIARSDATKQSTYPRVEKWMLRFARNDGEGAEPVYFFPTFSQSHCATAAGELVASLPEARRLASRIVAISIFPSRGVSALRKRSSLARFGASSTIAS